MKIINDKDDPSRSINSFKQMHKINQLYSDAEISTDNTQIDLLIDSIQSKNSDEDVFKVSDNLWDFLKMTYMVNIDYIKTNSTI